jgi:hypothetical protein
MCRILRRGTRTDCRWEGPAAGAREWASPAGTWGRITAKPVRNRIDPVERRDGDRTGDVFRRNVLAAGEEEARRLASDFWEERETWLDPSGRSRGDQADVPALPRPRATHHRERPSCTATYTARPIRRPCNPAFRQDHRSGACRIKPRARCPPNPRQIAKIIHSRTIDVAPWRESVRRRALARRNSWRTRSP